MKVNFSTKEAFFDDNPFLKNFFPSNEEVFLAFLLYHPSSPLFPLPPPDRLQVINTEFKEVSLEELSIYEEKILNYTLSLEQRALLNWKNILDEREKFLSSLSYSIDTWDIKDKMLSNTPKLWEEYERIKARLESSEDTTKQGIQESISEKGLI